MDSGARASQAAYKAIIDAFQSKPDTALEIEILPAAFTPPAGCLIFNEGTNIGIPKKIIVAAFLSASEIFKNRFAQADHRRPRDAYDVSLRRIPFRDEHQAMLTWTCSLFWNLRK